MKVARNSDFHSGVENIAPLPSIYSQLCMLWGVTEKESQRKQNVLVWILRDLQMPRKCWINVTSLPFSHLHFLPSFPPSISSFRFSSVVLDEESRQSLSVKNFTSTFCLEEDDSEEFSQMSPRHRKDLCSPILAFAATWFPGKKSVCTHLTLYVSPLGTGSPHSCLDALHWVTPVSTAMAMLDTWELALSWELWSEFVFPARQQAPQLYPLRSESPSPSKRI